MPEFRAVGIAGDVRQANAAAGDLPAKACGTYLGHLRQLQSPVKSAS